MIKPINVLSMCDGIGTGKVALAKAGIPVKYYLAAEIDSHCIKASHANYPEIIQLGNIYDINVAKIPFQIDLVFCGFPCQSFSVAGNQKKFDDPRGQVFWQGMKILYQCMKRWPNVKFLFENVRMDKHSCSIISNAFGFNPLYIDSALVCAQTRKRYYWTSMEGIEQPEDRGIMLQDILEDNVDEKYNLSDTILARINTDEVRKKLYKLRLEREKSRAIISSVGRTTDREYFEKNQGQLVEVVARINKSQDGKVFAVTGKSQCLSAGHNNTPKIVQLNPAKDSGGMQPYQQDRVYDPAGKLPALSAELNGRYNIAIGVVNANGNMRALKDKSLNLDANYFKGIDTHAARTHVASLVADIMRYPGNKPYCLDTACEQAIEMDLIIRRLTPTECHRLQGIPDGYLSMLSDSQQYKALGNGWQADTIAHILSYYKQ